MDQTLKEKLLMYLDPSPQHGSLEDAPLNDKFLDDFNVEPYQAMLDGGLPSPKSSNHDPPGSGQESPVSTSVDPFTEGDSSQPVDQSQGWPTNPDMIIIGAQISASQNLPDESTSSQGGNSSVTISNYTDAEQYQSLIAPSEDSLSCLGVESHTATVPSNEFDQQVASYGWLTSTHASSTPKVINNTPSTSVPASGQYSLASKPRNPSHLRHQIHPDTLQCEEFTMTAPDYRRIDPPPLTMSFPNNFTDYQVSSASPSYGTYPNSYHSSLRSRYSHLTDAYNQSQRFPALQNYQPFHESSLRSSALSNFGQKGWEAGQFQTSQYPDPRSSFQQQSNQSPYVSQKCLYSYSPDQYHDQELNSPNASLMSHASTEIGLNGSSPLNIKKELSSPNSDRVALMPTLKSRLSSPKPQKKRRVKRDLEDDYDSEEVINRPAFQTADLTDLDPIDQISVADLINAMHNTDNSEDNPGMKKTWEKVRKAKAFRIKEVCVELLRLTRQTQQRKGIPGERRSINHYASFEDRFDSLCDTLRSQKTVCKHLIEPPYSQIVVDDPHYAKERVKNNRRVNLQKAEAIRLGREHLGEKGQGKGKPTLKLKKRVWAHMEESQDDENSGFEAPSDAALDRSPHTPEFKSVRRKSRATKRTKRSKKVIPRQEHESTIEASSSPPAQEVKDTFAPDLHQKVFTPVQYGGMPLEHDQIWQGLDTNERMPTLNQGFGHRLDNTSGSVFYGDHTNAGGNGDGLGSLGYVGYN